MVDPSRAPLADAPARHGLALLILDMISARDFPDAEKLAPGAVRIAPRISALKRRCKRAGAPIVCVNDNRDRWRSEFRELAHLSAGAGAVGAAIALFLLPADEDYAVLKPKHCAFFATPLDLLLRHLRVSRVIITGVATDFCVSMSAAAARMRDYEVVVPGDCVAAMSAARHGSALRMLERTHRIRTTQLPRIVLGARPTR